MSVGIACPGFFCIWLCGVFSMSAVNVRLHSPEQNQF
uniref:Uncharacterized protein n=1 Tax=Anguilla anguilla TaxID=7936 RepID=A0A0E9VYU6_ANGAN